jgi:hypothetical protein
VAIWHIFPHFGILYQEKSGNPGGNPSEIIFAFLALITNMESI